MVEYRTVERCTKPLNLKIGEKLVIRLWSWEEARLLKDCLDGFEIETVTKGAPPPYYSVSTFALARGANESTDDLIDRLTLHAAEHRRFKWYSLVTESELAEAGFQLILNEPPAAHYDIPLGQTAVDVDEVAGLARTFGDEKIRMRT